MTINDGGSDAGRTSHPPDLEQRLQKALALARVSYWKYSCDQQQLEYWSDSCAEFFGTDRDAVPLTNEEMYSLVHPDDAEPLHEAYATEGDYVVEYRVVLPDDRIRHIREVAEARYDAGGRLIAQVGTCQDITELRQTARDLGREFARELAGRITLLDSVTKDQQSFNYSVSHDLRPPLRTINGFSSLLLQDYATVLDAQALDYLRRIRNASKHMDEVIDGLLELSRLSQRPLHRRQVDLSAMASSIAAELQAAEPERSAAFEIHPEMTVHADPDLMATALLNLLDNAWKFTREVDPARIEVGCLSAPHGQTFFVRDNGVGFDMAYAEKMFRVFERLHLSTDFEGTGLGLATVERIIRRHGGRIWTRTNVSGSGATFYFSLRN